MKARQNKKPDRSPRSDKGKPRKDPALARKINVLLGLTVNEKKTLEEIANEEGITQSDLLRKSFERYAKMRGIQKRLFD